MEFCSFRKWKQTVIFLWCNNIYSVDSANKWIRLITCSNGICRKHATITTTKNYQKSISEKIKWIINYFLVWCIFDVFIVFIIEFNILWCECDLRIDVVETTILLIFSHLLNKLNNNIEWIEKNTQLQWIKSSTTAIKRTHAHFDTMVVFSEQKAIDINNKNCHYQRIEDFCFQFCII